MLGSNNSESDALREHGRRESAKEEATRLAYPSDGLNFYLSSDDIQGAIKRLREIMYDPSRITKKA